jgi:hypothetical protein
MPSRSAARHRSGTSPTGSAAASTSRRRVPTGSVSSVIKDLTYTDEVGDHEQTILFWKGTVDNRELSGATVLTEDASGLISDITVLLRSWGVVANFRDIMLRALADAVPLTA